MKKIIIVALIIPIAIISWVIWGALHESSEIEANATAPTASSNERAFDTNTVLIGDPNAPVTIVEYADFKCPECGKFHADASMKIRETYVDTGKINIIFRPYPIYAGEGPRLLYGSYCAQEQGAFAPYHDALFDYMWVNHYKSGDYQKAVDLVFTDQVLGDIFSKINLNKSEFDACVESKKYDKAYEADLLKSGDDGVQGTPSFIIGGQKVVGPQPFAIFKSLIDLELKKID
jgi:protein-disulfide isomerase